MLTPDHLKNAQWGRAMRKPHQFVRKYGIMGVVWIIWAGFIACSNPNGSVSPEVFIQINENIVTVDAYLREVDEARADFSVDNEIDAAVLAKIQLRILNQLTERLILLERAKELGLQVSDEELEGVIASIKSDYPKGEFDQVLLEQAVSYSQWKNDMRIRMLMEKVIDHELEPRIRITPEEISAFYEKHYVLPEMSPDQPADAAEVENSIIQQVRNNKKEILYREWLATLKKRFNVSVNQAAWDRITARQ